MRSGDTDTPSKGISLVAPTSDHDYLQRCSKRLKRSSKLAMINIDDLPESVLVEILCRLPFYKFAFQCKCVSKRWCTLISNPYFVGRFLCLKSDKQKPIIRIPVFWTAIRQKTEYVDITSFKLLEFKTAGSSSWLSMTLGSLPPFRDQHQLPVVVATYNDLVLCCPTINYQTDYYICNPHTRQWVALPPTPTPCHHIVQVGFICNSNEDEIRTGTIIHGLNAEYRFKVVRIIRFAGNNSFQFNVEIFSSETGNWRKSVVSCPPENISFVFSFNRAGIAYNGMLYWPGYGGIIGLDPDALAVLDDNIIINPNDHDHDDIMGRKCHRFIEFDEPIDYRTTVECLGVCARGCLQMCQLYPMPATLSGPPVSLCVWQLKEDHQVDGDGSKWKWCLMHKVCLEHMVSEDGLITRWVNRRHKTWVLALDPNDDNIWYLDMGGQIVICNIRTRTLKIAREMSPYMNGFWPWMRVFSISIPWWPTPVPTLLPEHVHYP